MENLEYTVKMLRELKPKVDEVDALLASFIEMAYLHAHDLLAGSEKMRPRARTSTAVVTCKKI